MKISRNRDWDNASPQVKKAFMENLPLPYPLVIGIFLFLAIAPPYIFGAFLPNFKYASWIQWPVLIIFMLYIIASTSNNYKKKTGRNFSEDMNDIQNKYDVYQEENAKNLPESKGAGIFLIVFAIVWLLAWFAIFCWSVYGIITGTINSGVIFMVIFGLIMIILTSWFIYRSIKGLTNKNATQKSNPKSTYHSYELPKIE